MKICVYLSSSEVVDDIYFIETESLGKLIAEHNHELIYGGANVGLMRVLAESVKQAGAFVHGVIPQRIHDKGLGFTSADTLKITETMHERKSYMESISDAFIALPGGFGTMEELVETITLKQLGYHNKPIVIINTNGFYDKLIDFMEHIYASKFAKEDYRALYRFANDSIEAIQYIENYQPDETIITKWFYIDKK